MKKFSQKLFIIFILFFVLIGCSKDHEVDLTFTERIEVVSISDPNSVLYTLEEREEIDDFINKLHVESWDSDQIPKTAIESKMFKIYKHNVESVNDRKDEKQERNEIAAIITTFQDSSFIQFETKHVTLGFRVPKDVVDNLSNLME